ncbi:ABC transporter ATP-binding protein [Thioalkalivibrio sulfidiphilus]|uniref:ABC transporter related n=1 Tax=Thioalkalivibrio sulfidiphilus (strain HL-EbGR7) TaxID=396588 RepID=B8GN19_THISH|nr:ABC transporter ATP-binding protein [Thioalkalivibrio sulfidiphilus]ACL71880.1 ABC transporter related [Thioalkalivibrio sulfidiphilus HL-EbGr7]
MLMMVKRLWQLLTHTERKKFFMVLGMVMIMAALETVGVVSIMPFLAVLGNPDIVTEQDQLRWLYEQFGFGDTAKFIFTLGIVSALLVVLSSLFKSITQHVLNRFANLERHSISTRLLDYYLRQPYVFFLDRNSSELTKNMLSEVDILVLNVIQPVVQMIAHGIVVLAVILLLLFYDPMMACAVATVVAVLYILIYMVVRGVLGRIGPDREKANAERFIASSEAFGAIKEVKLSGANDVYLRRFQGPSRRVSRHLATNETLSQVPLYLVEAAGYGGLIAIALFLAVRSDNLGQVLPVLGLYGFAAYRLLPAAQIIYRSAARMRFGSSTLEKIHRDLMALKPSSVECISESDLRPYILKHSLEFNRVCFSYPGQKNKIALQDICATIPARTTVGVVGATGSGKSTLIDLLLGLVEPQQGFVKVDGAPLCTENMRSWQLGIGYVPQQIYIADSTVAENIAFGLDPRQIDQQAVERAARAAHIHDFIIGELPDGYLTRLGERGIRLSGGQRQRIGIARALYHDPGILVLDEATSALDSITELEVMREIRKLGKEKTIILIAHRLNTIRMCDKILFLHSGVLEGEGSYEELKLTNSRFAAMDSAS